MILTTASKETAALRERALQLSKEYGIPYRPRDGLSLSLLLDEDPAVFVVNQSRGVSYYEPGRGEVFYHPNMAFLRLHQLRTGGTDALSSVAGLREGMSVLDCTVGLASDALTAAYLTGEHGCVTGVEKSFPIYLLTKEGLRFAADRNPSFRFANRLADNLRWGDNLSFLRNCPDGGYDVVYFDFMFAHPLSASFGIQVIRAYAARDVMTEEHLREAVRAARQRVVVKTDAEGAAALASWGMVRRKQSSRGGFCYMVWEKD